MARSEQITVYVAEDHPVFQQAVTRAVQARAELELVGAAADGEKALEEIRAVKPDVALLDLRLPLLDGLDVLRSVQRHKLQTRVVMVSADSSSGLVYDAVKFGASGFLTKAATLDQICDAVVAVASGETVLAPEVQSGLVVELRERDVPVRPLLSARELEILKLVAEGLSGPEIGARLYISSSTVKTHVKSVLDKLGVNDRAAAVAEGMRRGLID
jgi:two-component system, NarL family, nitrate/nitrite response regulator NarL